jgi:hypothetical protein
VSGLTLTLSRDIALDKCVERMEMSVAMMLYVVGLRTDFFLIGPVRRHKIMDRRTGPNQLDLGLAR